MKPTSHGIAPKLDPKVPEKQETSKTTKPEVKTAKPVTTKSAKSPTKTPCSTYGDKNKCEGMLCKKDDQCASNCCSTAMGNGEQTCHAVIQGNFCPRALAPKVDYSMYSNEKVDYANQIESLE